MTQFLQLDLDSTFYMDFFFQFQIKESEEMVKKMEATHAKLAEAYDTLKVKSEKSASDAIKARSEANEFKSLLSFKENQVLLCSSAYFNYISWIR